MSIELANYSKVLKVGTVRDRNNSLDLRYGIVPGVSGTTDRWLVMCNGRTEWMEKYSHLPSDLNLSPTTGFMTWDHRGQGASGGARAWIDNYDKYSKDAADVLNATLQNKPFNLLCHSMGGLIALNAIMDGYINPRCVILSSPLIGLPHKPMDPAIAFKVSKLLTTCGLGHINSRSGRHHKPPFERNLLTHSGERYLMIQNTLYPVPSATFEWVKASYEASQAILNPEKLKKLTMPILVLCGTEEAVVDINAIQPWVALARQHAPTTIDMHWIQGGRHELFFESKPYFDKARAYAKEWFTKVGFPL